MSGTVSQVISFNEIPFNLEVPGVYTEVAPNYQNTGLLPYPSHDLIIAGMLATGTATAGVPYPITRPIDATTYFGAGSLAERHAIRWLDANGASGIPLDAIGLTDAGGAAKATGTYTIAGASWPSGTPALLVGDTRYQIGTLAGDSPTTAAAEFAAAINADPQCPAVVTVVAGVMTVTAKNAGVTGNDIRLLVSPAPGDILPVGMTIVASGATLAAGATNPSIASAIAAIVGNWYTGIGIAYQDTANVALFTAELMRRQNAMVKQDAIGFVAWTGTLSQQLAKAAAANCKFLVAPGLTNPLSPPWALTGSLQGLASAQLAADPARQLRGLAMPNILGSMPADRRIETEEQQLLIGGVATLHTNRAMGVTPQKLVSTYTVNAEGVLDPAFHEIHESAVASRIRYDWNTYIALTYPRAKLAPDGSIAAEYDRTVVTPKRLLGSWAARMRLYEENGWIVNGQVHVRQALFVIDPNFKGRVNARQPYERIGNLYVLAGQIQFQV